MSKICTGIEDYKKLKGILPLESSDMHYEKLDNGVFILMSGRDTSASLELFSYRYGYTTPAWSLSSLLDILRSGDYRFSLEYFKYSGWGARATFNSVTRPDLLSVSNEPIDACCKLILELNKGGLL